MRSQTHNKEGEKSPSKTNQNHDCDKEKCNYIERYEHKIAQHLRKMFNEDKNDN